MRIGLVTQWFPPESPSLAASTMAEGLASRGHHVEVVTGFPNYPHGKLYPGYRLRPYMRDSYEGISVHRGPLYPSHDNNPIQRIANYSSFALGAIPTSARFRKPDVWLTNSTPITVSLPAMLHRVIRQTPHAQIIQDLWPDSLVGSGFVNSKSGQMLSSGITPFCNVSYKLSDSIGVISPGMADILASRGVARDKIEYLPNGISDSHLLPDVRPSDSLKFSLGLPTKRLFMYAGNFGPMQNLCQLIDSFSKVHDAHLILVGSGVDEANMRERAKGLQNVHFVGRQPVDEIGKYIAASDIQIVSLADTDLLSVTMPSKVQAALAAGRPVFAHAPGDAARIVVDHGCGIAASPANAEEAAAAIKNFTTISEAVLTEMGLAARKLYDQEYSISASALRMESFLLRTIERSKNR